MGAIVNGLALHGFRGLRRDVPDVLATTCAASIRLAALMKLPSIFVYTHDSIGLGEDGPTHQPIEHLAALRAMPRLQRRAARRRERDRARVALRAAQSREHPTAFALSRQGLPILDPDAIPDDAIERGAYVLRDAERRRSPS